MLAQVLGGVSTGVSTQVLGGVDVLMAILKEFREMADGKRGRKAHRPADGWPVGLAAAAEVPEYGYEKFRAPAKVE